jgi:hypothetical protein
MARKSVRTGGRLEDRLMRDDRHCPELYTCPYQVTIFNIEYLLYVKKSFDFCIISIYIFTTWK